MKRNIRRTKRKIKGFFNEMKNKSILGILGAGILVLFGVYFIFEIIEAVVGLAVVGFLGFLLYRFYKNR